MILSDLSWAFLQPGGVVIILLLLALLFLSFGAHRTAGRLLALSIIMIILPALIPIQALLVNPLENRLSPPNPMPERVDGIIVLGGAVNWTASQGRGQLNVNGGAERVLAGAALKKRYPDATLVFTGIYRDIIPKEFTTQFDNNFFFGSEYERGQVIFLGEARSTYEEAIVSQKYLNIRANERWMLVTSAYHMPRAYLSFKAQGLELIPYPVDYSSAGDLRYRPSLFFIGKLAKLDETVREWGALLIYRYLGRTTQFLP